MAKEKDLQMSHQLCKIFVGFGCQDPKFEIVFHFLFQKASKLGS